VRSAARAPVACLALAAASLLLPSTLTYDPWSWMGWGRDLASLSLDTGDGPAFKPLPVLVGFVLSPLGDAAPWVWLVLARAAALLSAVVAWRVAARLAASHVAGGAAAAGVLLTGGWLWHGWFGNAEGVLLLLALLAFERALAGQHRPALALALAAALVRTEAAPFLLVYCGWLWRRDPGVRAWIAAGLAALPVAWLGPDLLAAGDAFRSSERARVPNPGAPALADHPALESLRRASALAPAIVWAGLALAGAGAARRELPRLALLPAAAGAAWIALIAGMAELGYSGEPRYAMPGVALLAVTAGPGLAWATEALVRNRARVAALAAAGAVALALAEQAPTLAGEAQRVPHEVRLYDSLDDAVAAAGGREAVLRCGPVNSMPYSRPALAWRLRVPIPRLSTNAASSGTMLRARPRPNAPFRPATRGARLREIARAGEWVVLSSCERST
jgi:hypothetical protein